METKNKWIIVILSGAVLLGIALTFGSPIRRQAPVPQKTAAQVEQEELVKKIESGSSLWEKHNLEEGILRQKAEQEHLEKQKVQAYVSGYRMTLCAKYNMVISSSGSLAYEADCASHAAVSFQ